MNMILPKEKTTATRVNPKTMVLFSLPKMGKTTAVAALDDCLIIDLEEGSEFVDAMRIDVIKEAKKKETLPIDVIKEIIDTIRLENKKQGKYAYKYIALDTVTALEDLVLPLANKMYRETPMGRTWVGNDVTSLPSGAGYLYTRRALSTVLAQFEELCDTLIILGHVKDKLIEKDGEEMTERGLDLTGKMASILCAHVDTIGYVYRDENKTMINFKPSENLISGSRSEHLKDQKIVIAESNSEGNVTVDWSKIFK